MMRRAFVVLLGVILLPIKGYSLVPTVDVPGTLQVGNNVTQTLNSIGLSESNLSILQSKASSVGTWKTTISEYMVDIEKRATEEKEKIERAKKAAEEYKVRLEEGVNTAKGAAEQAKGYYDQAQDTVEQAKSTAEDIKNQAQSTISPENAEDDANSETAGAEVDDENVVDEGNGTAEIQKAKAIEQKAPTSTRKVFETENTPKTMPAVQSGIRGSVGGISGAANNLSSGAVAEKKDINSAKSMPSNVMIDNAGAVNDIKKTSLKAQELGQQKQLLQKNIENGVEGTISQVESIEGKEGKIIEAEVEKNIEKKSSISAFKEFMTDKFTNQKPLVEDSAIAKANKVKINTQTQDSNIEIKKNLDVNKVKTKPVQPTRATFKTSYGYGSISQSYPLAFAQLSGITKTGDTPEGITIVPVELSVVCGLDYENAPKDTKLAECYKKINGLIHHPVDEEYTQEKIANYRENLSNAVMEMLASQFFEALEIYNESIYFKNKVLDPVLNATTETSTQNLWPKIVDLNQIMGSRLNKLSKLNARALALKGLETYQLSAIKSDEEDLKK